MFVLKYFQNKLAKNSMAKKWIESKYKTQNKNSIKSGVDPSSKRNIIISLTSHPKRFKQNYIAIESLLSQSLKPNKIILWLAEDEASFDEVSEELKRAQKRGLEIAFCRQSLRSYNKLIHTLKIYGDSIIVTADDDIMYPDYWLKELYETYLENSDCIICYRGLEIKYSQNAFEKYFLWKDFKTTKSDMKIFPTGVSGILYPKGSLNEEIFNEDIFKSICPTADDVWFKAMSLLKDTKCRKVFVKSFLFPTVSETQGCGLGQINKNNEQNDIQLKQVFDKYKLYEKLI